MPDQTVTPRMTALLRVMMTNPDGWYTVSDLFERSGVPKGTVGPLVVRMTGPSYRWMQDERIDGSNTRRYRLLPAGVDAAESIGIKRPAPTRRTTSTSSARAARSTTVTTATVHTDDRHVPTYTLTQLREAVARGAESPAMLAAVERSFQTTRGSTRRDV